jgi:ankyrin repeat protein
MKKDKEFLSKVIKGDKEIINLLKKDKTLKNIKDDNENNIVHYLIAGEQVNLTKELLKFKLINYTMLKGVINELLESENYKNDNYYSFLSIMKENDQQKILKKHIDKIIKNNNKETLNKIQWKKEELKNLKLSFISFIQCNDETLENALNLYKIQDFELNELKYGFYQLRSNKIRTSILMENLKKEMNPFIYEELNRVNEYCGTYLENRDLYNKLEKKLENKNLKILKKI